MRVLAKLGHNLSSSVKSAKRKAVKAHTVRIAVICENCQVLSSSFSSSFVCVRLYACKFVIIVKFVSSLWPCALPCAVEFIEQSSLLSLQTDS